jgi:hypothetical protein
VNQRACAAAGTWGSSGLFHMRTGRPHVMCCLPTPGLYEDIGIKPPKVSTAGPVFAVGLLGGGGEVGGCAAVELPLTNSQLYEDIGIKPPKVGVTLSTAERRA